MDKVLIVPFERIATVIHLIRGQKVMLDRDLAKLYEVPTRALKQAVRRNLRRFPADFMFELTASEFKKWRSQFVIFNADRMGLRHAPMTEELLGYDRERRFEQYYPRMELPFQPPKPVQQERSI